MSFLLCTATRLSSSTPPSPLHPCHPTSPSSSPLPLPAGLDSLLSLCSGGEGGSPQCAPQWPWDLRTRHSATTVPLAVGSDDAASSATSDDFDYPLAAPSVYWPHLHFRHLPAPRFPATSTAPPAPGRHPGKGEPAEESSSGPSSTVDIVEPLDSWAHHRMVKRLSKLALRRARNWWERVAGLADRVLALPPGAPVADVLDDAWVSPDELAYVVRAVGAASWCRALDGFEWLVASGTTAPGLPLSPLFLESSATFTRSSSNKI